MRAIVTKALTGAKKDRIRAMGRFEFYGQGLPAVEAAAS